LDAQCVWSSSVRAILSNIVMSVGRNLKTERVLERKSAGRKARLSSVQLIQAATKLVSAIG